MFASPLITREMLLAARSPLNYRLRLTVGAVGTVLLGMAMMTRDFGLDRGGELFFVVHNSAMVMLLFLSPLMTADIISKERREGTLDLLFLTPVTALKIVRAKYASQLLRMLTVWAVLGPLTAVPLVAGGLSPGDIGIAMLIELAVVLLGLIAGLGASALCQRTLPAMILATIFNGALLGADWWLLNIEGWTHPQSALLSMPAVLTLNLLLIATLTWVSLAAVARHLLAAQRKAGESAGRLWFRNVFLTPRYWKSAFRSAMARKMDRNPLIWLEYRTAWSRGGRWMLVALLILWESSVMLAPLEQFENLFESMQVAVGFGLMLILAVTAASSFQKERENGAFELLLVAPFSVTSLLGGRLRAVWSYYLPVVATLVCFFVLARTWSYGTWLRLPQSPAGSAQLWSVLCSAITIPLAGLYFALRVRHFLPILAATIFLGLVLPLFFWPYLSGVVWYLTVGLRHYFLASLVGDAFASDNFPYVQMTIITHVALAAFFYQQTHARLRARQFI